MKKFLGVLGALILAAALVAGGYYAGTKIQTDSIVSALPKKTFENLEDKEGKPPIRDNEPISSEMPSLKSEVNIIEKNTATATQERWSVIHKASVTLSDGSEATVQLHTSAEKDSAGEYIWDDGNQWVLEVQKGNEYYTLINKYVQLGEINYIVGTDESDNAFITAVTTTGTGISVEKFTYNGTAFEGQTVYNSGVLNVYSSTFQK